MLLLTLAGILVGLIGLLLLSRVKIEICFSQHNKNHDFSLTVRGPLGLTYKLEELPNVGLEHEAHSWRLGIQPDPHTVYGEKFALLWPALRYMMRRVNILHLSWQTKVGTGDAAVTALVAGSFWSIKGGLFALLQSQMTLKSERIVLGVYPDFQQLCFQTSLQCIVSLRIVHLIIAPMLMLRAKFRRRKGVDLRGRSSHSRADEDGHGKHPGYGRC